MEGENYRDSETDSGRERESEGETERKRDRERGTECAKVCMKERVCV